MPYFARFRSNVQLQVIAIEVLEELMRRDLLEISVWIVNLRMLVSSRPSEVYATGSNTVSSTEFLNAHLGLPATDHSGPGVTIRLKQGYKIGTDKEEEQVRTTFEATLDAPSAPTIRRYSPVPARKPFLFNLVVDEIRMFVAACAAVTMGNGLTWIIGAFASTTTAKDWGVILGIVAFGAVCVFTIPDRSVRHVR